MSKLYFNTFDLETKNKFKKQDKYSDYVYKFAKINNMEIVEYQSLNEIDTKHHTDKSLNLWDDYKKGVKIKKYELLIRLN